MKYVKNKLVSSPLKVPALFKLATEPLKRSGEARSRVLRWGGCDVGERSGEATGIGCG